MVINKAFAFNVIFKGCVGSWLVLGFQIYKLVMNNVTVSLSLEILLNITAMEEISLQKVFKKYQLL